jgi:hypothetical protein
MGGRVYTRPGKPGKVMESENRQKSQGKVMKNRENLKKTWKSHGICRFYLCGEKIVRVASC